LIHPSPATDATTGRHALAGSAHGAGCFCTIGRKEQSMDDKIIVKVLSLKLRPRCSVNGNPRYRVTTDHGTYDTVTDASCNYGIENDWRGKTTRPAQITLHRGKIVDIIYLDDCENLIRAVRHPGFHEEIRATPRPVLRQTHLTLDDIQNGALYLLPDNLVVRPTEDASCVRVPDSDGQVASALRGELAAVLWNSDGAIPTATGQWAYPLRLTTNGRRVMRTLARYLDPHPRDDHGP
jgi:hypothetical protein